MKHQYLLVLAFCCAACSRPNSNESNNQGHIPPPVLQCSKDTDCKGDRICENGKCAAPTQNPISTQPAPTPSIANDNTSTLPANFDVCAGIGTDFLDQLVGMTYRQAKDTLTSSGFVAAPLNEYVKITKEVSLSRAAGINEVVACTKTDCGHAFTVPNDSSMNVYIETTPSEENPFLWEVSSWSKEDGWCRE